MTYQVKGIIYPWAVYWEGPSAFIRGGGGEEEEKLFFWEGQWDFDAEYNRNLDPTSGFGAKLGAKFKKKLRKIGFIPERLIRFRRFWAHFGVRLFDPQMGHDYTQKKRKTTRNLFCLGNFLIRVTVVAEKTKNNFAKNFRAPYRPNH